eukprot:g35151.t1
MKSLSEKPIWFTTVLHGRKSATLTTWLRAGTSAVQNIINDLDEEIERRFSKFADDTKLGGSVSCEEDAKRLQGDLDRFAEWENTWQIQYNVDISEVIHFGHKNRKADYYLNGGSLGKGEVQQGLSVMVEQLLKVGMQVQQAVRAASDTLPFIARGFEYRSKDIFLQLYRAL